MTTAFNFYDIPRLLEHPVLPLHDHDRGREGDIILMFLS